MNKILLVIGREYATRVQKKSFLITTLLVPIVIIGFYAAIIAIALSGNDEKQRIAVIDPSHVFDTTLLRNDEDISFTIIQHEQPSAFIKKYKALGFEAFLHIYPTTDKTDSLQFILHSEAAASLHTMTTIENNINNALRKKTLLANGIDVQAFDKIDKMVKVQNMLESKDGAKKSVAGISYAVSFGCGILIYMMMIIYGTQVMRGVTEEKTNRIAEVVVSSVKPFQLMMGKIVGIGAVGLTQFLIWLVLIFGMQMAIPVLFPDLLQQINQSNMEPEQNMAMAATILQGMSALPIGKIVFAFLFYFLGGYLTYASLFAAVGSVVSEDQQEAQQLVFPILMPIIVGFVIMTKAINDPDSSLAVFGSIFPLTSPIVMMGRITYQIPVWQLALSMFLLVGSFLFFTWLTGKIYRIGILMYGKKPSWKEMIKWAFAK